MADATPEPHRVAVLALPDVVAFELGLPSRFLGGATSLDDEPLYDVRVCTLDGGPVMTTGGYQATPEYDGTILDWAQTVVIPGIHSGLALTEGRLEADLAAALGSLRSETRLMSICTSAFVLAALGLLDGRPATTHWMHSEKFQELYPKVLLDPDVLFVDDGDVLTSAGNAAGIDLCLHVIRRDHGAEVANRVARRAVVAPWRGGGQSQFIDRPLVEAAEASTAPTRAWVLGHLDRPVSLEAMARRAAMSVRTFTRRFRDETGMSPGQWLLRQRVEHARHLLEATDLPVDQIASQAGFGTAASLRQHLHAAIGVPPMTYRRTFRPAALDA